MQSVNESEVFVAIRSNVGEENLASSYVRKGCRMFLADIPSPRVVVDADLAFDAHKICGNKCDYIVFLFKNGGKLLTVPVELKGESVDASEVHAQLQQGANFAARILPLGVTSVCIPVLIHKGRIHEKQRKKLGRAKIRFCGQQLTIKTQRCKHPKNLALALRG